MFYAAIDTELWFYDTSTGTLDVACAGLLGETEALEMIPGGLILFGVHNDRTLKLHALEPTACEVVADEDIPTNQFDDVEGIALPTKACIRQRWRVKARQSGKGCPLKMDDTLLYP